MSTVQDRILAYLIDYLPVGRNAPYISADITQVGISKAVGKPRPHIQMELKKLQEKGLVLRWKAHVNGYNRICFVYLPTVEGVDYCNNTLKIYYWGRYDKI